MLKNQKQLNLIVKALSSAEDSIALAKKLLEDYSGVKIENSSRRKEDFAFKDLPGVVGVFDGQFLVEEGSGKKYQVPENYASKSKLVVGDKLKMVQVGGRDLFKQVSPVDRVALTGSLKQQGEAWFVSTSTGSYQILPASVKYYNGQEGDQVSILIPADNPKVLFGTVDSFPGKEKGTSSAKETPKVSTVVPTPEPKPIPVPVPKPISRVEKEVKIVKVVSPVTNAVTVGAVVEDEDDELR